MNPIYELDQKVYTKVQEKAAKHGKEIKVESDKIFVLVNETKDYIILDKEYYQYRINSQDYSISRYKEDSCPAIQEKQIRQILLAFSEELGGNPELDTLCSQLNCTFEDVVLVAKAQIEILPQTNTKALADNWFSLQEIDGQVVPSLFDQTDEQGNPTGQIQVLTELLEVLENL